MPNENLINRLKAIVSTYAQNKEALNSINEETDFINDLKINSANLVDVILDVEEEFDIVIDNDAMEKMLTVKASIAVIEAKLSEK
ncbi:acyl carrier protein [Dyadobacter sediminis]|uniref:Acyl carrier protein n=1 Tax=Dyadobacter sediminis TaxID=1493691 RepID=A0A5R9KB28_9BACT|nr:phosphopantetheine-binding protein [Dyadobacter sediminis]TLU92030.1 acyl carrier protein [Dyadobacter sediminis]GGB98032.1 acyl carrier protein [Dyadobacter sediminis]